MKTLNTAQKKLVNGGVAQHPDQQLADWAQELVDTIRSWF